MNINLIGIISTVSNAHRLKCHTPAFAIGPLLVNISVVSVDFNYFITFYVLGMALLASDGAMVAAEVWHVTLHLYE